MPRRTIAELQSALRDGALGPEELGELETDPRAGVQQLVARARRRIDAFAVEQARLERLLRFERRVWSAGATRVAGVDEVGAGPLAGPVYAAAVILEPGDSFDGIDDSKKLSRAQRESLAATIRERALGWALGICSPAEIDELNIRQAAREAMRRAVLALDPPAEHLLVDARRVPGVRVRQTPIDGGDGASQSIAAASIIAKVERDAEMSRLAERFPGYGFESNRGYPTADHMAALARLGPCDVHRRSFQPVRAATRGLRPVRAKRLR